MNLQDLNESQRDAVLCTDAPMLVIAGAGSGKTRVLTYKIAYLLTQGYQAWEILALTFTNKAAREMQSRIAAQVGQEQAARLWMGTFHSIFCRILRIEAERIGFSSNFTIYDAADSKVLVTAIIKEMGLDEKQYKPSHVCSQISRAKNSLVRASHYAHDSRLYKADEAARTPLVHEIYTRYVARCRQANALDFDDILLYTWELLNEHPDVREKYAQRFRYVLVDEYQDTNFAQHRIVWLLAGGHKRVCVVGDDAQSIYSFRGANIDNILQFRQQYEGARLFKLEQNYRSTETIVGAANSLIHHNSNQIRKEVFSRNGTGSPIELYHTYSDAEEAGLMVRRIRRFAREDHTPYSQMAVLYRTNAQSRSLEESLRKEAVPYRIYGGLSFYQRKEVKDIIAYFRLAVNPDDEVSFKRVINYPARGIGQTTLEKILAYARDNGLTPWQVLADASVLGVNRGTLSRLENFRTMIQSFVDEAATADAYTLGLRIVKESGMQLDIFSGHSPEDVSRQENVQELLDGINLFVQEGEEQERGIRLTHYLQEVSLLSDMDEDDSKGEEKVTLMTIHSAKGLEFDVVIVTGMEENLFPSQMSIDSPRQIEEERRLFYVAMTRARHHLILTHARSRFRYGKTEFCTPSRFLAEIDSRYLKAADGAAAPRPFGSDKRASFGSDGRSPFGSGSSYGENRRPVALSRQETPQPSASPRFVRLRPAQQSASPAASAAPTGVKPGDRIAHDRFGEGVVVAIEGTGLDAKARVNFDNAGEKQLLLRFAKFRVL